MTSTLAGLLDVFDVDEVAPHCYVGNHDAGDRDVIDASQVLAQAVVAAGRSCPDKTVRKVDGVFCRPIRAAEQIELDLEVLHAGRLFSTAVITARQGPRVCATITALLDLPAADVIRHPTAQPASSPDQAIPYDMPLAGRELRLVGLADPNDPDEVGPPRIDAWLHYDQVPERDDLRRALVAHFTGHLSISTTMRAHAGVGTVMSHRTLSTAVMAIDVTFHDPVEWSGWLLYEHESTAVCAGMSYVRGQVRDEAGRLLASFTQDGMIRAFDDARALGVTERARL